MPSEASPVDPEGIHNFRELAGYEVDGGGVIRRGRIYRSGALERMTESDAAYLVEEIGVRTILDLRHSDELALHTEPHALAERVVGLSIFPNDVPQQDLIAELNGLYGTGPSPRRYLHYLEVGGDRLTEAFALFADEANYPILVHCTAGKDRTGVLLGMLMHVLGCSDEDIAAEYGLSDASIDRLIDYLRATGYQFEGTEDDVRARLSTPPERMAGFIDLLCQHHGSAEAFFAEQGISPEQFARIRALLIEGVGRLSGPGAGS